MKKQVFRVNSDGFNGAWYPAPVKSSRGLIIMLGDSSEDHMARTGAKWLHEQGLHVMAMIKVMWLVMGGAVKASLPVLGISDPETFWKEAKKIYRREMDRLPEYGPNDILKVNLAHAVMLSAVYEACDPKPDIDALTKFYREFFLRQRIIIAALKKRDMLKPSEVKRQIAIGERSQNATHPFTWQFKVQVEDENRYTAVFTRCGIYDYLNSRGMAHIAPAMCAIDYLFGECSNHWFLRESTIATGGEVCDCRYVSKKASTSEEIRRSKENKRAEAIRGGRKEF